MFGVQCDVEIEINELRDETDVEWRMVMDQWLSKRLINFEIHWRR